MVEGWGLVDKKLLLFGVCIMIMIIPLVSAVTWTTPSDVAVCTSEEEPNYKCIDSIDDDTSGGSTDRWDEETGSTERDENEGDYEWSITYDMGSSECIHAIQVYADGNVGDAPCKVVIIKVCDDSACSGESNLIASECTFSTTLEWQNCILDTDTEGRYIQVQGGKNAGFGTTCQDKEANDDMEEFHEFKADIDGSCGEVSPTITISGEGKNVSYVRPDTNVKLYAQATAVASNVSATRVIENSTGSWVNHTTACGGTSTTCWANYTIPSSQLSENETVGYYFWANNTVGNITNTSTYSFTAKYVIVLQEANTENLEDARTYESQPDTNYGASTIMTIGDGAGSEGIAYIKFNLSKIDDLIGAGTVVNATLKLISENDASDFQITASELDNQTWIETQPTYNNPPGGVGGALDTVGRGANVEGIDYEWIWNVTSWVISELDDGNAGVSFEIETDVDDSLWLRSKEHADEDYRPSLTVYYTPEEEPAGDSCSCPSPAANWDIHMPDHCNITSSCDITGFNLTFTNGTITDMINISNTITSDNMWFNMTGYVHLTSQGYLKVAT